MEKQETWTTGEKPARILIVEDDPDVRGLLADLVRKFGLSLCGAVDNGEDAIHIIQKTQPDIIFIDIVLGGSMNGVDLARHINKEFGIPFVYITGYSDEQLIEQVIHTTPAAFILKPFRGEEIQVAVEIIMKKNRRAEKR